MTSNEERPPEDELARQEAEAAAEEAGSIGGASPDYGGDEEQRARDEAGGGVSEGFEASEEELIEAASHGERRHNPAEDEFTPEERSDESGAEYGEADQEGDPEERG
jgi:hypothetical protein